VDRSEKFRMKCVPCHHDVPVLRSDKFRMKCLPCHHGMARPGGCLQIWRVSANVLNKHQRPADSLGLGKALAHHTEGSTLRNVKQGLGHAGHLWTRQ
jgi:ribosomal protein S27E